MREVDKRILNVMNIGERITTERISKRANIDRSKTYRRLKSLKKYKFVNVDDSKTPFVWIRRNIKINNLGDTH